MRGTSMCSSLSCKRWVGGSQGGRRKVGGSRVGGRRAGARRGAGGWAGGGREEGGRGEGAHNAAGDALTPLGLPPTPLPPHPPHPPSGDGGVSARRDRGVRRRRLAVRGQAGLLQPLHAGALWVCVGVFFWGGGDVSGDKLGCFNLSMQSARKWCGCGCGGAGVEPRALAWRAEGRRRGQLRLHVRGVRALLPPKAHSRNTPPPPCPMQGHSSCVEFLAKFNVPMILLGGGGEAPPPSLARSLAST